MSLEMMVNKLIIYIYQLQQCVCPDKQAVHSKFIATMVDAD